MRIIEFGLLFESNFTRFRSKGNCTMKTAQSVTRALLLGVVAGWLLVGATVRADTITITQNDHDTGSYSTEGASFTPSVNDAPPTPAPTTVDLTQYSMDVYGRSGRTDNYYLQIYTGITSSGGTGFVGSSTNGIVYPTADGGGSNVVTWSFNNLALNYTTKYYALFSTTSTQGNFADTGAERQHGRGVLRWRRSLGLEQYLQRDVERL